MKTVNLELSKQLKKAGYPQGDGIRWYNRYIGKFPEEHKRYTEWEKLDWQKRGIEWESVLSPTADEILEQLPVYAQFEKQSLPFEFRMHKTIGGEFPDEYEIFYCRYRRIITDKEDNYQERVRCWSESLADAAAKCWLCLKKEGLV